MRISRYCNMAILFLAVLSFTSCDLNSELKKAQDDLTELTNERDSLRAVLDQRNPRPQVDLTHKTGIIKNSPSSTSWVIEKAFSDASDDVEVFLVEYQLLSDSGYPDSPVYKAWILKSTCGGNNPPAMDDVIEIAVSDNEYKGNNGSSNTEKLPIAFEAGEECHLHDCPIIVKLTCF